MNWKIPLQFALLCTWAQHISALYEDQAGKFDWRQQYIGQVSSVQYDPYGQTGKRITVATGKNVLASINVRSGDLVWRQLFENDESGHVDDMLQVSNSIIVVLDGGSCIRSFSASVGTLQWEIAQDVDQEVVTKVKLAMVGQELAVLSAGSITVRNIDNGQELWTKKLSGGSSVSYQWLFADESSITVAGVSSDGIVITTLNDEGVVANILTEPAAWAAHDIQCIKLNGHLLCLDSKSNAFQSISLSKPKKFKSSTLKGASWPVSATLKLTLAQTFSKVQDDYALVHVQGNSVLMISVDDSGVVSMVKKFDEASSAQLVQIGDQSVLFTITRRNEEKMDLVAYDVGHDMAVISDMSGPLVYPAHHGDVVDMYALVYKKKDGNSGARLLLLGSDTSISLAQGPGKLVWCREEALSSVVSVEMLDLPVSDLQAQIEEEFASQPDDILAMFINRFSAQYLQLKDFLLHLRQRLMRSAQATQGKNMMERENTGEDNSEYLTRDEFNLHKMIVVATETGKLFGIDSTSGNLLWKVLLQQYKPFDQMGKKVAPLFVQRTTSHFPFHAQCVVVGQHKVTGLGVSYTFDPMSGISISSSANSALPNMIVHDYKIKQVTLAPNMNKQFIRPVLILDDHLQVHVYPDNDKNAVTVMSESMYLYTTDVANGKLTGYQIVADEQIVAKQLWQVDLQKSAQTITNVVPKRPIEHVHSQGIVLADRSVMYKYLNPNLLVVTAEGIDVTDKPFVNVYLIDAISGHIVFHCLHKRAQGPLNIVHSENWVVYKYWNERHRRNEMAAIEMYEGRNQGNATAFSSLYPPNPPIVMRQAYIFNLHASAMAATITEKGITTKHIMIALQTGGVLELPKAFVDPRRPVPIEGKPLDNSYREEGIMPYVPELPYSHEAIVNYNNSIYNVRGIHTSPAGLESTCLVLCYGLDLFYTRVMPSKMFDVLKDDFDYIFISSVLFAMIAVSVVSQKLAARKAMKRAWR